MNFSCRQGSIQHLKSIYPDEEEEDLILDGGNSVTDYSMSPLIDCGNVIDSSLILDGGNSFNLNCSSQTSYLILDGGNSSYLGIYAPKIDLGNSENTIINAVSIDCV